ncbi:MAG: alpha/beta hydrolase [Leptospiraceae bacterium]|nr:MAG: alpha/beta hydrolase [Leptospiraceae bacterium]
MKKIYMMIFFIFLTTMSCISITPAKGDLHHPVTKDGWKITLEHFFDKEAQQKFKRKYPVILCHGLMANRTYYTINGENSFAVQLAKAGYDVWVLDLRGREAAGSPSWFFGEKKYNYSIDDYIKYDVDAAIQYVLEKTNAEKVNWVGHSMGGMIAYARIGSFNETRIANLITVGSPFSFELSTSSLRLWHKVGSCNTAILPAVPMGTIARFNSYMCIDLTPRTGLLEILLYPENTDKDIIKASQRYMITNIAAPVALQLKTALELGDFYSLDGKINYTENLKNIKIPTLMVLGRRDHLGFGYTIRLVYENISSNDKQLLIIERAQGASEDYGHGDLFLGKNALNDVMKPLIEWLNKRN